MKRLRRRRRRSPLVVALYVNAAVMLVGVGAVLSRDGGPRPLMLNAAMGQAQPGGVAGGAGLFLMPAQFSTTVWGCYIMDVDQQTLCAYTVSGSPPQLRLVAARDFRNDRRLRNYNTPAPSPEEVKDIIAREAASGRVIDRPGATPEPQPPPQAPFVPAR